MSNTYEGPLSRYLLMLPLPRSLEVAIEDRFLPSMGASRPSMGYHISVVGPFYWVGGQREIALGHLRTACAETRPIRVLAQGLDVFENGPDDSAVFVAVGPVRRLRRVRAALLASLGADTALQYQRSGPYRPHITLGLSLTARARDGLLNDVASPFQARFCARELWLLEQRPYGPWRPLLAFQLGADAPARELDVERHDG